MMANSLNVALLKGTKCIIAGVKVPYGDFDQH